MKIIDFHSHILPEADHGCQNVAECTSQLALINAHFVNIAVATPHFYPHIHNVDTFLEKIENSLKEVKATKITTAPTLCVGAEVLLCKGLHEMQNLDSLCVRGTNTLLIELPFHSLRREHFETVEQLISNGYTVLLAHIDRYFKICPDNIDDLLSMGAIAQINADALNSHSSFKKIIRYLETTDKICAIGSDLHGSAPKSYKPFSKASKTLAEYYESIMNRSSALLDGAKTIELQ